MRDEPPTSPRPTPGRLLAGVPHRTAILWVTLGVMAAAAAVRLPFELWRLLLDIGRGGAIDLRLISDLVKGWFSGAELYTVYPPASHLLLWPFQGWLPFPLLRWAWAASMIPLIGWLALCLERAAGLEARLDRAWFRLFVLSNYATAIVIGNGQLALHIVPALLVGILLLRGDGVGPGRALAAGALLLLAMAKPSLSVPFFWVVLFACGARRVVAGCVVAYLGLTAAALAVRPESADTALGNWLSASSGIDLGYANLHSWSRVMDVGELGLVLGVGLLGLAGLWTLARRRADLWILLGVAAIVARVWTYHQLYDDLLLLIPVVALLRIGRLERARERNLHVVAGMLVLALWVGLMGPGTLLRAPVPLGAAYRVAQTLVWAATLGFLVFWAEQEPDGESSGTAGR